jgi:hypothetical protein
MEQFPKSLLSSNNAYIKAKTSKFKADIECPRNNRIVWLVKDATLAIDAQDPLASDVASPGDVDANIENSKRQPTLMIESPEQPIAATAIRSRDHKPAGRCTPNCATCGSGALFK